ncbi:MAG: amidohydrolase, partial [Lentisphaerae bacterium]|nr:amidohydrolase [Lentisphaerota bacterium]
MTMTVPWQRQIEESIEAVLPEVVRLRHRVHRHPELAMQETATAALVREVLAGLGLEPRPPLLGTDVIAMIEGAGPGPNVTLRADMDALPLQECTGVAYASECPGVMHACGHDGHTAM